MRTKVRECNVDNNQAITAVKKGYSKKLRQLPRTQRVAIGVLTECVNDKSMKIFVDHCPTDEMKGDMFTKALQAPSFEKQREAIGIVPGI